MNSDGQVIPVVEDDQGEGVKDFLDIFDVPIHERFTDSKFFEKLEKFRKRKNIKEIATSGNQR